MIDLLRACLLGDNVWLPGVLLQGAQALLASVILGSFWILESSFSSPFACKRLAPQGYPHLSKTADKEALQAFMPSGEPEKAPVSSVSPQDPVIVRRELEPLLPGFMTHRREDAAKLRSALGDEQMEAVRAIGHALAGTGGSYGFQALTDMGRALEAAAKAADRQAIEMIISQLEGYLDHVDIRFQ